MKTKAKGKLLAILMSLAVAFTVMPMTGGTAHAASAVTIDGVKYTLNEKNGKKTATVSGHTNEFKGSLFIPGAVSSGGADYAVTGIGEHAFKDCKSLTSVTIPGSVTNIGYFAFMDSSLTDITFVSESNLDYIGRGAFRRCVNLRSITIPKSVTSIEYEAFDGFGLRSVTFESGSAIEGISLVVFHGCGNLRSITIPKSVTSIWDHAFRYTGLTSVVIPSGVNCIKSNAFGDCGALDPIYYVGQEDQWDGISKHSDWTGGRDIPVRFVEKAAEVPTGKTFIYNGKEQTGVEAGEGYFLEGPTKATNAGTYTVTARKNEGYDVWTDGTTADSKEITWEIRSAAVTVTGPVTAPAGRKLTYNGKTQTGVAAGTGYTLSGTTKATGAGTYTAKATLKSNANYTYRWTDGTTAAKTIRWTISKAANPLTVKAKKATVKGAAKGRKGKLKKTRTLPVRKVIAFAKKGRGKMTYAKVSGNKKIRINKTTGKVTVKKGLRKGTYRVKVKVRAAGDANYNASAWKTVTFRIKVK